MDETGLQRLQSNAILCKTQELLHYCAILSPNNMESIVILSNTFGSVVIAQELCKEETGM